MSRKGSGQCEIGDSQLGVRSLKAGRQRDNSVAIGPVNSSTGTGQVWTEVGLAVVHNEGGAVLQHQFYALRIRM